MIENISSVTSIVDSAPSNRIVDNFSSENQVNFNSFIDRINSDIVSAEANLQDFITGDNGNLHQVILSIEKAKLSVSFMTEVRDRLVNSYQEISRMQV